MKAIEAWLWMVLAFGLLAVLSCSGPQARDGVIVVEASAIERCGDRWCVTDGWMMETMQDLSACNDALADCVRELGGDE